MIHNNRTLTAATAIALAAMAVAPAASARNTDTFTRGWTFTKIDDNGREAATQQVRVPHDWAVHEPFSRDNDLQVVAVEQNGETEKTEKTGRTGGLPYMGKGRYTTTFEVPDTAGQCFTLIFDGAMSHPHVSVNGKEVGHWAYGYNSFYLDIPQGVIRPGENTLSVSLENKPQSSRWYPGAGLYRNVHLVTTSHIHVPVWGTYITTPYVSADEASVKLITEITGAKKGEAVTVQTDIIDPSGKTVATNRSVYYAQGQPFTQNFFVPTPTLWDTDNPALYVARTTLSIDGKAVDEYSTRFGIRSLEYIPEKGFFLNGKSTKFKGVCNHHDLGPLGAAVNRAALRHQIELLKDMGANAIRTSHNMPAPELVELCDEMGMMLMVEPFDDWGFRPKSPNGYGSLFGEWAEKDMVNMVRHYRNNPSVVMWSIGNEVPSQWGPDGVQELQMLLDIAHREDPTRPVTCGMDQIGSVLDNGFAAALDIPGFNYKPQYYVKAYNTLPQKLVLGSETASTVSSRGCYMFPMELKANATYPSHQSSSYDTEFCYWSNIPDLDFAADDDYPWMIGQFVWTGFDYLGEPSPYDTDAWPNHSSVFGIIDLASLPKDRYYLYRSHWNKNAETLHILPHWNWEGREGEVTPVFVYTNYPSAELFINGKSQGKRTKDLSVTIENSADSASMASLKRQKRYRLMWMDTKYEPGTVKVVAYDKNGKAVAEKEIHTAGKPHHIELVADRSTIKADGKDLSFVTVKVVDKDGNLCPHADNQISFRVKGKGTYRAGANGDPTSLESFQTPRMKVFNGMMTAIVQSTEEAGTITLEATAKGLKKQTLTITTEQEK